MKPKQHQEICDDMFRSKLDAIINMRHPTVILAGKIDWRHFDEEFGALYAEEGRPGIATRRMVGLHILKHTYGLSDEEVCDRWVENPYFQYFTGETYFQHKMPIDRSSMSRWRTRIGADNLAKLVQDSLRIAHDEGALRTEDLKVITVDTTVQPKAITYPTDAKLAYKMIVRLAALARKLGIKLRQSYLRVGKLALIKSQRYAHAKQFKRQRRAVRFLRVRLGRLIRDLQRKTEGQPEQANLIADELEKAAKINGQVLKQRREEGDPPKLYSPHAPEVECIAKGKAHKPYEFGCKVTVTTTNAAAPGGHFVLHIEALHGNPYDGHTLANAIEKTGQWTGVEPERAHVDKGYQGHGVKGSTKVFQTGAKRGVTRKIKKEMRLRAAVEPVIGHMKSDGHLDRNYLLGADGDKINAVLCGLGQNIRLLLRWFKSFLRLVLATLNLHDRPAHSTA